MAIMKDCKKILFIMTSLEGGGAEKILLSIIKYLDREKYKPYLALLSCKGEYISLIPPDIRVIDLKKKNRSSFFMLVMRLAFRVYTDIRPEAVVSFLVYTNMVSILAKSISPVKPFMIISERNYTLRKWKQYKAWSRALKRALIGRIYSAADIVTALSAGVAEDLSRSFRVPEHKTRVIYNGVDLELIRKSKEEPVLDKWFPGNGLPVIIGCGRLVYQKGFPLLLKAFSLVQKEIDSVLVILGQGQDRARLEDIIKGLDLKDRVYLAGFRHNPYKYMAASDVFVLSSHWEGFANVVIEAMACGIPVVSTRCGGPEEIISDGINGILLRQDTPEEMAHSIIKVLSDKELYMRLKDGGSKRAGDFGIMKMVSEYQKAIGDGLR